MPPEALTCWDLQITLLKFIMFMKINCPYVETLAALRVRVAAERWAEIDV